MSSVTSSYAQVARRLGYFVTLAADISGYVVDPDTSATGANNSWTVTTVLSAAALQTGIYGAVGGGSGKILEDMGELAKVNGQLYRKVRLVTQTHAGGAFPCFWIIVPGGEYPIQGFPVAGGALPTLNTVSAVARLG